MFALFNSFQYMFKTLVYKCNYRLIFSRQTILKKFLTRKMILINPSLIMMRSNQATIIKHNDDNNKNNVADNFLRLTNLCPIPFVLVMQIKL